MFGRGIIAVRTKSRLLRRFARSLQSHMMYTKCIHSARAHGTWTAILWSFPIGLPSHVQFVRTKSRYTYIGRNYEDTYIDKQSTFWLATKCGQLCFLQDQSQYQICLIGTQSCVWSIRYSDLAMWCKFWPRFLWYTWISINRRQTSVWQGISSQSYVACLIVGNIPITMCRKMFSSRWFANRSDRMLQWALLLEFCPG